MGEGNNPHRLCQTFKPKAMKVIINNKPNEFIAIFRAGDHWQCNTRGHASAHSFNSHPKYLPKGKELKTNGCVYVFPSK